MLDEEEIDDEDEEVLTLPNHLRCAAHTLNLICTSDVKKTMENNLDLKTRHENTLKKCVVIWNKQSSPKQYEIMRKHLDRDLHRPVVTR